MIITMRTYKILFFLITSCIVNFSCSKDKGPAIANDVKISKHIKLSDNIKEWALFKLGSYWIVKDSVTNTQDSIYLTSVVTNTNSKYSPNDTVVTAEETQLTFSSDKFYYSYKICSYPNDHVETMDHFFTVFQTDTAYLLKSPGGIQDFRRFPNLNIGGNTLNDLIYVMYSYTLTLHSNPNTGYYAEKSYWKKNIGVVKRRYLVSTNPQTIEMIRCNVIQ